MDTNKLTVNINKTKYMVFNKTSDNKLNINYMGNPLEEVNNFKYLGVILDKNLSWDSHIKKLLSGLSAICGLFKKISSFVPISSKLSIFHSLFQSRLLYGILIWGPTYKSKLKKIQSIQNKAIKNLYKYKRSENRKFIHKQNQILPVLHLLNISQATHIHNIKNQFILSNTQLTANNHHYNTRNRDNVQFNRINTTNFGSNSSKYAAIKTYNSLPNSLKILDEKSFKTAIKSHYLKEFENSPFPAQ